MSNTAIKVENLSKIYRLGEIGTGTISRDMERWFKTRILKQEDPFLKIGETNDRANKGVSDIVYSLQDINFEINQGDAVGIIGRNGAGKSTLLKILSRVTTPTTGKINIKGRVASLLEVGTGFHPELTGRENIYLNGAILGMRKREIDRKLDEIIDFSGVERYIDTPVKRYSSGMYVRLAFAVAAHLESEILIVDEVLAVGDAEFQKKCLGKMGEVSKGEGRTVLFVSHNLGAIQNLCPKSITLSNGQIKHYGSTFESINYYLSSNYSKQEDLFKKLFFKKYGIEVLDFSITFKDNFNRQFKTTDEISIEIILSMENEIDNLRVGFDLINSITGDTVFRSFHDDLILSNAFQKGNIRLSCMIPKNLLSEGEYFVSLIMGIHKVDWLTNGDSILKFSIVNLDGINSKYNDFRPGLINPQINWFQTLGLSKNI
jgi:lipopolysaccharide transport system ATP-binding protein